MSPEASVRSTLPGNRGTSGRVTHSTRQIQTPSWALREQQLSAQWRGRSRVIVREAGGQLAVRVGLGEEGVRFGLEEVHGVRSGSESGRRVL